MLLFLKEYLKFCWIGWRATGNRSFWILLQNLGLDFNYSVAIQAHALLPLLLEVGWTFVFVSSLFEPLNDFLSGLQWVSASVFVPAEEKHPCSMAMPPPCFTVGMIMSKWYRLLVFCHIEHIAWRSITIQFCKREKFGLAVKNTTSPPHELWISAAPPELPLDPWPFFCLTVSWKATSWFIVVQLWQKMFQKFNA